MHFNHIHKQKPRNSTATIPIAIMQPVIFIQVLETKALAHRAVNSTYQITPISDKQSPVAQQHILPSKSSMVQINPLSAMKTQV